MKSTEPILGLRTTLYYKAKQNIPLEGYERIVGYFWYVPIVYRVFRLTEDGLNKYCKE